MPNKSTERYTVVGANAVGPVAYAAGNRPTITLPCRDINNVRDVKMWCDGGFSVRPVSRARNVVTYMFLNLGRAGMVAAVQNHAAHAHGLLVRLAAGAKSVSGETNALGDLASGLKFTVTGGNAVDGGVQNFAAMAHVGAAAATKVVCEEEVLDGTVLNAVNVYAEAMARVW